MELPSIVLFQDDARTAQILAENLSQHVGSVHLARTYDEIGPNIARHRAEVLVLDLENCCLSEVKRLHREFPDLSIVCTHRLADEELWTEALNQGAADMCEPRNTDGILRSVMRERAHGVAAETLTQLTQLRGVCAQPRDLIKLGLYGGTAGMLHLTRLVGPLLFGFGRKDE